MLAALFDRPKHAPHNTCRNQSWCKFWCVKAPRQIASLNNGRQRRALTKGGCACRALIRKRSHSYENVVTHTKTRSAGARASLSCRTTYVQWPTPNSWKVALLGLFLEVGLLLLLKPRTKKRLSN